MNRNILDTRSTAKTQSQHFSWFYCFSRDGLKKGIWKGNGQMFGRENSNRVTLVYQKIRMTRQRIENRWKHEKKIWRRENIGIEKRKTCSSDGRMRSPRWRIPRKFHRICHFLPLIASRHCAYFELFSTEPETRWSAYYTREPAVLSGAAIARLAKHMEKTGRKAPSSFMYCIQWISGQDLQHKSRIIAWSRT